MIQLNSVLQDHDHVFKTRLSSQRNQQNAIKAYEIGYKMKNSSNNNNLDELN